MSEAQTIGSAVKMQNAVLIDLDYAVLQAMKPQIQASCEVLSKAGVTLDEFQFLKNFAGKNLEQRLNFLAQSEQKALNASVLATEISDKMGKVTLGLLSDSKKQLSVLVSLLKKDRQTLVGILSALPEEILREQLGDLIDENVNVFSEPQIVIGGFSWENWRRLSRKLQIRERMTVAIIGSGVSTKSALAAGMHVIVRPDPMLEYQDFSGADSLCQTFDESIASIVDRLLRRE